MNVSRNEPGRTTTGGGAVDGEGSDDGGAGDGAAVADGEDEAAALGALDALDALGPGDLGAVVAAGFVALEVASAITAVAVGCA